MRRHVIWACTLLTVLWVASAQAQLGNDGAKPDETPKPDERVGRILKELDLKSVIDKDGDYKVLFDMGEGRSQVAFIISGTSKYRNLEVREIWSFAYRSPSSQFPASVANRLLEDTWPKKLGAWAKVKDKAVFVVKLSANADKESLLSALMLALRAADHMEESLSGDTDAF